MKKVSLKPNRKHIAAGLVGAALTISAVATKNLVEGTTAVRTNIVAAQQNAKAPVPFQGPFAYHKKGVTECGPAVRLMEGALRNAKIRKTPVANCVGKATTKQLIALQKKYKIPVSGIYGLRTHKALSKFYNARQRADLTYLAVQRLTALRRSTVLIVTSHAKIFERRMIYCDAGSLAHCGSRANWPLWPDVPRHTDCSGYVSWVLFQSGVPNPNGIGVGTTKTLIWHGIPVPPSGPLKIGDLVFYGNNTHVAIYIGHGLVSSHGKNYIDIRPYGYRTVYAVRRYF